MELNNCFYEEQKGNKELLLLKGEIDFSEIKSKVTEDGYWKIKYENFIFDIFYKEKKSDILYVFFNGSRVPGSGATFKRWSYYPFVNGSYLNIDDCMYQKYPDLYLGWYNGDKDIDYIDYIIDLIKEFSKINNISKYVFFGSSGGGNAAIRCAAKLPGIAVTINPQLIIEKYPSSNFFSRVTGNIFNEDKFSRNDTTSRMSEMSKYIFIENVRSKDDLPQLEYLLDYIPSSVKYGLNKLKDNVLLWLYDADKGETHNNQDYNELAKSIFVLISLLIDDYSISEIVDSNSKIYEIITDLWHEHYVRVYEEKKQKRRIAEVSEVLDRIETITNIELKKNQNKYNNYILPFIFLEETTYRIRFKGFNLENSDNKFHFVIKDLINETILLKKEICEDTDNIIFVTGRDVRKISGIIYSGLIGETDNKSLKIKELEISIYKK